MPQGLVVEAYQAIVTALQVDSRYSHLVDGRLADLRSTKGDADILRLQRWHDALSDAYIQAAQVRGLCNLFWISTFRVVEATRFADSTHPLYGLKRLLPASVRRLTPQTFFHFPTPHLPLPLKS
jgi:hypothetical protein